MQRSESNFPSEIITIDIDYKLSCMNLVALCNSCKKQNQWNKIRFFIAESLICKNCGRRHYAPIPNNIIEIISKKIEKLLKRFGKICFWGINPYFFNLARDLKISDTNNIYCVDTSKIRQGIRILDGRVQASDIINDKKIKCIVVTVPQYYPSLKHTIKEEFHHLKKLLSISDLLSNEDL